MKCPHCGVTVHIAWRTGNITLDDDGLRWGWQAGNCPACNRAVVYICKHKPGSISGSSGPIFGDLVEPFRLVQPQFAFRNPLGDGAPTNLKEDYLEACAVLDISAKASAALSRRVLQGILQQQGYLQRMLADQIDAVLAETDAAKALPTSLKTNVDVIRKFGNFPAHPIRDKVTSEIIDVEPEEAAWCLELVELLFDHYYIRPTADAERLADFNRRLQASGQPPTKV